MNRSCAIFPTLLLLPVGLLASHAARATAPVSVPVAAQLSSLLPLPPGVHSNALGHYTRDVCDHARRRHCMSQVALPDDWTPGQPVPSLADLTHPMSTPPAGMGPTDILAAYDIPAGSAANGAIVAILDAADSHAYNDLKLYRAGYHLPVLPKCSTVTADGLPDGVHPCFAQVSETGGTTSGDGGSSVDTESSLDMDMISAACPDCSILFVDMVTTAGNVYDQDIVAAAATAIKLGAVAVSISWGGPEFEGGLDGGYGPDPDGFTVPGHLVLASSGDSSYDNASGSGAKTPSFPSSAPDVVSVGGTTLFLTHGKYDEAVWFSSTSGCSTEFAMPLWQQAVLSGTGCTMRADTDLAAPAAYVGNGSQTDINIVQSGAWSNGVEGTSAASPIVAAILTRLGLAATIADSIAAGKSNWIYDHATSFNDLGSTSHPVDKSGSSTNAYSPKHCGVLCNAGPGWDGPSGVGSPNGALLSGSEVDGGASSASSSTSGSSSSASTGESSSTGTSTGASSSASTGGSSTGASSTVASSTTASSTVASSTTASSTVASSTTASSTGASSTVSTSTSSSTGSTGTSSLGVDSGVDASDSGLAQLDSGNPGIDGAASSSGGSTSEGSTGKKDSGATRGGSSSSQHSLADASASADGATGAAGDSGGCSCTESPHTGSGVGSLAWLGVGLAALTRRRRRGARPWAPPTIPPSPSPSPLRRG